MVRRTRNGHAAGSGLHRMESQWDSAEPDEGAAIMLAGGGDGCRRCGFAQRELSVSEEVRGKRIEETNGNWRGQIRSRSGRADQVARARQNDKSRSLQWIDSGSSDPSDRRDLFAEQFGVRKSGALLAVLAPLTDFCRPCKTIGSQQTRVGRNVADGFDCGRRLCDVERAAGSKND